MLDFLLRHRFSIATILSIGGAVLVPMYLWIADSWPWWGCILIGLACLLFVPLLWGILLGVLEMRRT